MMGLDRAAASAIALKAAVRRADYLDAALGVALPRPHGYTELVVERFAPVEDGSDIDFLERMLGRSDRVEGPAILWDWHAAGLVGREHVAALIASVWSSAEYPESALGRDTWVRLFRYAGYVSDPPGLPAPVEPVTVYRGAPPRYARGMAWARDRDTAGRFADGLRSRHPGVVYAAVVEPAAVLARCEGRSGDDGESGEVEYVIDPNMLPRPVRRAVIREHSVSIPTA